MGTWNYRKSPQLPHVSIATKLMVAPIVRDPLSSTRKKDIGWFEQSNGWMRLSTSLDPHHLQIDCHQGCGGCPVRDNPGDPGRAVLQLLCPRRRHHNDRGWNGHLQHRQECREIQGDCLRLQIADLTRLELQWILSSNEKLHFSGMQKDPRGFYYQPSGKVENWIFSFQMISNIKIETVDK